MLAMNKYKILGLTAITIAATILVTSCKDKKSTGWEYAPNMYEHIAFDPDQKNPNFKDGKTAQLPPAGTTPVGFVRFDYPSTKDGYDLASTEVKNALAITEQNMADGKALFNTFCFPCHGANGQGDGPVTEHG